MTCSISIFWILASSIGAAAGAGDPSRDMQARLASATTRTINLERDVSMFLRRILVAFVIERRERLHQFRTRHARQDHFVDVAALGGHIGAGKTVAELRDLLRAH